MGAGRRCQRVIQQTLKRVVDPDIAIDHQKGRFTQQRQRIENTTRGLQRRFFRGVGNAQIPAAAVSTVIDNLLGQVRDIDNQLGKSSPGQAIDMVTNQRNIRHWQQGFGCVVGQGAHTLPHAGRKNHGFHCVALHGCCAITGDKRDLNHW